MHVPYGRPLLVSVCRGRDMQCLDAHLQPLLLVFTALVAYLQNVQNTFSSPAGLHVTRRATLWAQCLPWRDCAAAECFKV